MPTAKKNPLSGYVSLIGGLIPILGILLAMIVYVINLNSTISDNAEDLASIQEQLEAAKEILEVNPYGESELSNRINGIEYFIYEEIEQRINEMETRLLLIDESLKDISETQTGTAHYLYTMQEGPQKRLAEHIIEITKLKSDIDNILAAHVWYNSYLSLLDAQLLEIGIRVQPPQDIYSGGYSTYR
tara:strand:+ start:319 stop:879 length:561 start_codon:yes stop_codon:yes gene_type:complete